jgi:hypothetical protein
MNEEMPEETKYKRKKNDGEIQMWERGERKQRRKKVKNVL